MNFDDQSMEMKRTLLEASVGGVSMSAHLVETNLKLILFSCFGLPDEEFDKEWSRPRTLGRIIRELEPYKLFSKSEMAEIDSAKDARNSFTHCLSDFFSESIQSNGSIFELIVRFNKIKSDLDIINSIVTQRLHEQAALGGVDVNDIQHRARNAVDSWEGA
tara:strand:- start:114 stop:596 length:483 start_codon:yes stop_codon:yes gene_type:complete